MAKVLPYYAPGSLSARFYDLITAADTRLAGDEAIYAGLAPAGGTILELGAGSGRLTAALAGRGFRVTAVDISPVMLAQARARLAGLTPEIQARAELVRGDMTALDLKRASTSSSAPTSPWPTSRQARHGATPSRPRRGAWRPAGWRPSTCHGWT